MQRQIYSEKVIHSFSCFPPLSRTISSAFPTPLQPFRATNASATYKSRDIPRCNSHESTNKVAAEFTRLRARRGLQSEGRFCAESDDFNYRPFNCRDGLRQSPGAFFSRRRRPSLPPPLPPAYANFAIKSAFRDATRQRRPFPELSSLVADRKTCHRQDFDANCAQHPLTHTPPAGFPGVECGPLRLCTWPAANKFCGGRFLGQTARQSTAFCQRAARSPQLSQLIN